MLYRGEQREEKGDREEDGEKRAPHAGDAEELKELFLFLRVLSLKLLLDLFFDPFFGLRLLRCAGHSRPPGVENR